MTDKENKLIEQMIKRNKEHCVDDVDYSVPFLINLIEKQSKEIEELKEDSCCMTNCVKRNKEKIFFRTQNKSKIEEYKEKCKNCNFKGKICKEFTKNYNCVIAVCLNEFYSLLEKEFPTTITKEELEKGWEE